MKKIFALALLFVVCFVSVACGGGGGGQTATQAGPPDLQGEWKQVNSSSKTSYQAATISGDTIEVYWVNEENDSRSLYWAGSFVAPQDSAEPYTWESENDKSKTDKSLLASGDDTKAFTYQKGQISYSVSAMGTTQTVKLEK